MGVPLVTVRRDSNGQVTCSQSRFLYDKENENKTIYTSPYGLLVTALQYVINVY